MRKPCNITTSWLQRSVETKPCFFKFNSFLIKWEITRTEFDLNEQQRLHLRCPTVLAQLYLYIHHSCVNLPSIPSREVVLVSGPCVVESISPQTMP